MLLNWLKNDIAKDLALVKGIGAGLKGRRTSVDKPAVAAVSVGLLGSALGFVGEMLSGSDDRRGTGADEFNYVGEQWATHGHNGPFDQWTED